MIHQLSLESIKLLLVGDHRCRHRHAILHLKSPQNIHCILSLSQENMTKLLSNLQSRKIMHQPNVSHLILWSKISLANCNRSLLTCDKQIIHIQQKNERIISNHDEIEIRICITLLKTYPLQESILEYQALGACFKPYKAFFSLQTWDSLPWISKPWGCSTETSSCMIPLRNAVFTSIWWIFQPIYATMEIAALIEEYRTTNAKISS